MKNNISRINLKDLRHIYISLYEEIENYNIPFQKIELMLEQKQEIPPISEIFSQINLIMHLIKQNSHWDKIKRCGMVTLVRILIKKGIYYVDFILLVLTMQLWRLKSMVSLRDG